MKSQRRTNKMDEFDFDYTDETIIELSDNKGDDADE